VSEKQSFRPEPAKGCSINGLRNWAKATNGSKWQLFGNILAAHWQRMGREWLPGWPQMAAEWQLNGAKWQQD
jgi:hypothetical protein